MRRRILTPVLLIPSVIFLAQPLRAQGNVDSARRFVESIYRLYDLRGPGVDLTGRRAAQTFDTSLVTLMREDQKVIADGEVGVLDGDPICGCQDWDGIFDLKVKIRPINSERAEASVSFALFNQAAAHDYRSITLTLSHKGEKWRVYDVVDRSNPKEPFALRKELQKEIASIMQHSDAPAR